MSSGRSKVAGSWAFFWSFILRAAKCLETSKADFMEHVGPVGIGFPTDTLKTDGGSIRTHGTCWHKKSAL